jgi:hypothetical protein
MGQVCKRPGFVRDQRPEPGLIRDEPFFGNRTPAGPWGLGGGRGRRAIRQPGFCRLGTEWAMSDLPPYLIITE